MLRRLEAKAGSTGNPPGEPSALDYVSPVRAGIEHEPPTRKDLRVVAEECWLPRVLWRRQPQPGEETAAGVHAPDRMTTAGTRSASFVSGALRWKSGHSVRSEAPNAAAGEAPPAAERRILPRRSPPAAHAPFRRRPERPQAKRPARSGRPLQPVRFVRSGNSGPGRSSARWT